jgi:hypothetical protein
MTKDCLFLKDLVDNNHFNITQLILTTTLVMILMINLEHKMFTMFKEEIIVNMEALLIIPRNNSIKVKIMDLVFHLIENSKVTMTNLKILIYGNLLLLKDSNRDKIITSGHRNHLNKEE